MRAFFFFNEIEGKMSWLIYSIPNALKQESKRMKMIRSAAWPAVRKSCWEAWSGAGFNLLCGLRSVCFSFAFIRERERNTGQKLSEWLELKRTSCLKLQDCYFYRTMGHCSRGVQEQGAGTWEREPNILSRENSHSLPDM